MTVRRLYAPNLPEEGGLLTLGDGPTRHVRVLRLRVGDEVELFDGDGRSAAARIVSLSDTVDCEAAPALVQEPSGPRLILMLAIPKGSTLDDSVRMATELGVDEIALMQSERSVPRWDVGRACSRVERLTRVAEEAAAQSERADLPLVHLPASCPEWIARVPETALRVVFAARAEGLLRLAERPEQIWCAVGPEGGFSDEELRAFQAAGFAEASLGRSILRVDTAVAAALTVVQDRLAVLQPR